MTGSDNFVTALLFVLALNLIMFFVAEGFTDLGVASPFNTDDLVLTHFDKGNYTTPNTADSLPDTQAVGIDPEDNNVYTDLFTSTRNWLLEKMGLGWVLGVLDAPAVLLTAIGLSPAMAWAITALWYGINLLILVLLIFGK